MLWACGAGEVPEEPLQIPEVDGEAWDAHIEIGRPGHRIQIRADSLREFSKSEQVVATGGVEVAFRGDEAVSTLRAERLVLEHKRDRFGLAGGVVLRAGDSLEVQADTLLWENAHEQLRIPGALRVEVGEGREWGRNLTSNFAVDAWSLEAVEGPSGAGKTGRSWKYAPSARKVAASRACKRSPTTASRCATMECD